MTEVQLCFVRASYLYDLCCVISAYCWAYISVRCFCTDSKIIERLQDRDVVLGASTWCVRKVMTLNAWLDNWQCCSHASDTRRDIHSDLMNSASFNWIALTHVI